MVCVYCEGAEVGGAIMPVGSRYDDELKDSEPARNKDVSRFLSLEGGPGLVFWAAECAGFVEEPVASVPSDSYSLVIDASFV